MSQLTADQYEILEDAVSDLDDDAELRPDYSGRAMYGRTCIAITCTNPLNSSIRLAWLLAQQGIEGEQVLEMLATSNANTDNMGLQAVLYWPNIEGPQED